MARFPGLNLYSAGSYLHWGGTAADKYAPSVRRSLHSFVEDKWREHRKAELTATGDKIRKLKAKPAQTLKPGKSFLTKEGNLAEVVKVTHHGKRIVTRLALIGKEVVFRPGDQLKPVSKALAREITGHFLSHKETIDRYGLSDAA